MITRKMFIAATGHEPRQDDLERANCPKAGQIGHAHCGWDHELNLPVFMAVVQRGKVDPPDSFVTEIPREP